MAFDLDLLTSTPDLRSVAPVHARIVRSLRYTHLARRGRGFCCDDLADALGAPLAVHAFLVFLDEAGRAWPEPIVLNPPCQTRMSYDEMLLVDCITAAAKDDRATFDGFLCDMLAPSARAPIWIAARRLMRRMAIA